MSTNEEREAELVAAYEAELAQLLQGFAANLRRLRPVSQGDLASAANLHRTELGKLEGGRSNPNLHTLLILADTLHVTLDELVQGLLVPRERKPSAKAFRIARAMNQAAR
ncbi:MAG: helix-turn-helix domain-containing protein [Solirubrobacteraceae bacterium]|jgi:transcriptional regulator with XRE-family HTH domain